MDGYAQKPVNLSEIETILRNHKVIEWAQFKFLCNISNEFLIYFSATFQFKKY